jgi:branched-chain amino acid transport system ATP-binding protein/sulfate-transporting ATPase
MNASLLSTTCLSRSFGGLMTLSDLNLDAGRNSILGLIGPNGSGKTTFFNVVTGIYAATSGQVSFEGRDLTSQSPQTVYRAGISRTFQRSRLWLPLSIFDNIIMGDHKQLASGLLERWRAGHGFHRPRPHGRTQASNPR